MKEKNLFFNPFRLISPKLDTEANRLKELFETPPEEVTCLEEGLLIMINKIIEMTKLIQSTFIIPNEAKLVECERLAREVHDEEKGLTGDVVCSPTETTGEILKAVVLFPGRLERVGDHMERLISVSRSKAKEGLPFSPKATSEVSAIFDLYLEVLSNFKDALATRNKALLEIVVDQANKLGQLITDAGLAHEDRLIEGLCTPKASSMFLDLLGSLKHAKRQIRGMSESLLALSDSQTA
jgi:Na+/phosphate symporter